MNNSISLSLTSFAGFVAVALGAFGAHYFKAHLGVKEFEVYQTGITYLFIHTLALLALDIGGKDILRVERVKGLFWTGNFLFSGSLILYAITSNKFFALVAPFGGVSFMVGWLLLSFYAYRGRK